MNKRTISFMMPTYRNHKLLQGPKKMAAFRFPQKLLKKFSDKSKKLGLDKTELLEMTMISIIEKAEIENE